MFRLKVFNKEESSKGLGCFIATTYSQCRLHQDRSNLSLSKQTKTREGKWRGQLQEEEGEVKNDIEEERERGKESKVKKRRKRREKSEIVLGVKKIH